MRFVVEMNVIVFELGMEYSEFKNFYGLIE